MGSSSTVVLCAQKHENVAFYIIKWQVRHNDLNNDKHFQAHQFNNNAIYYSIISFRRLLFFLMWISFTAAYENYSPSYRRT